MQQDESVAAFAIAEQWRVISPLTTTNTPAATGGNLPPSSPPPPTSSPANSSSSAFMSPSAMTAAFLGAFSSPSAAAGGAATTTMPNSSVSSSSNQPGNQLVISGQASLFLARDATGNQVVLKKTVARTKEKAEEAQREVFILRKCNHGNIVSFCGAWNKPLEVGEGLEVNLVIELCYGGNLLDYQRSREASGRRLTELEIVRILVQAARAVEHLHKFDPPVAHRDVKLENFLLATRDNAKVIKLCDLGSATMERTVIKTKEQRAALESQVERLTTPFYRAPELCDLYSRKEISEQVDIWSLGCLLYVLAYNVHAFTGNLATLNCSYSVPSDVYYSQEFKSLFSWMLDPDPTTRPRIGDVVDEVDLLLGNKVRMGAVARGTGRGERSSAALLARAAKAAGTGRATPPATTTTTTMREKESSSSSSSNTNRKNKQSSSSTNGNGVDNGATTKIMRGSAFVVGGGALSAASAGTRNAVSDARRAARMNNTTQSNGGGRGSAPASSSKTMKTPFDDVDEENVTSSSAAGKAAPSSNNPFDEFDAPSFDPTFFSNPGMQSSSLAGFKDQMESRPYVSMMSIQANALQPGQVHTPSLVGGEDGGGGSSSSSSAARGTTGVPQLSQYPMFFSDPPKHYNNNNKRG